MRRILTTLVASGLFSGSAMAAVVEFRGASCVTAVTASCPASGWVIGDCQLLRFSPPGVGTNGPTTEFTLMGQSFGDNYSLATGTLVGTILKPVDAYHVGRSGYKYAATMRITRQVPATILATTPNVLLIGTITNFSNSTGCNVTFRATGALRP